MSCSFKYDCPDKLKYEDEIMCPYYDIYSEGYKRCLRYHFSFVCDDSDDKTKSEENREDEELPFLMI